MFVLAVWLLPFLSVRLTRAQEDIEIDFEPIGPGGPGGPDGGGIPMDAIGQLLGGGDDGPGIIELGPGPQGPMRGPPGPKGKADKSKNQQEAALDDMLADMFGAPPGSIKAEKSDRSSPKQKVTKKRLGDGTVIIEEDMPMDGGNPLAAMMNQMMGGGMGDGGPIQIIGGGPPPGVFPLDMRSSVPVSNIRDLFPGPHPQGHKDANMPFNQPDPMIMDMMQDLDRAFTQNFLPTVQRAAGVDRVPDSCKQELSKHCNAQVKSQLHCLGKHPEEISAPCRKDVGKSVPFLCSPAIDKFCDVLEKGILNCLGDHIKELDGPCKDAVITTHHVISKVNSQKASITNKATGEKIESKPSTPAPASREAMLDKELSKVSTGGKVDATPPPPPPPPASTMAKSSAVKSREAELDAKLAGLPQAPARSLSLAQDPDHFEMLREPATTFRHPASPAVQLPHNPDVSDAGFAGYIFRGLVALGIIGLGLYIWAFTDIPMKFQEQLRDRDGVMSLKAKNKDDLELPRPGFL